VIEVADRRWEEGAMNSTDRAVLGRFKQLLMQRVPLASMKTQAK
jgi:hypothetical protein